ncbi:glycosyltransferase family 4 protein [Pedobacter fastidiosus]|uniref:Glycosyltransferase family 4 protein n=1 Tax=Pedobacter fastidiosus TaxID=2765361 RepID=A0ABR7KWH4_9SPHI|nr:glycosyltransferase family 1 protein [Pedobacter fastidiosus]MBC6112175.1 glycosyltransferase family 4 protein [Pedobacter fastidiosus]
MLKVKIGIPFNENYAPNAGGGFSYTTQLIKAIDNHQFNEQIEIVFLDFTGKSQIQFKKQLLSFHPFKNAGFKDFVRKTKIILLKKLAFGYFKTLLNRIEGKHAKARGLYIAQHLQENKIAFLFYANPDGNTFDYPFVTTHWDIGHSSTYMFPEFTEAFESRKHYYEQIIIKALAVLTETETGKKELVKYTNLNEKRIFVMPMFPGAIINHNVNKDEQQAILNRYGLRENEFFIYPAQFWAHKNHIILIDSLKLVLAEKPNVKLVFTGSNKGNLDYIKNYIQNENLGEHIKVLGFVSNEELYTFYKNAIALTMPTFLGPSNMPPLEAANLGCPVILSDLEGHRELMGAYASYFNPLNTEELSEKMLFQINMQKSKKDFENKDIFSVGNAMVAFETALLEIIQVRKNWQ